MGQEEAEARNGNHGLVADGMEWKKEACQRRGFGLANIPTAAGHFIEELYIITSAFTRRVCDEDLAWKSFRDKGAERDDIHGCFAIYGAEDKVCSSFLNFQTEFSGSNEAVWPLDIINRRR